jgi:GMP synthase (glutamine-hydrolysing)
MEKRTDSRYRIAMEYTKGIAVLDFGGQYAHLIASRIRRMGAYSEIFEPEVSPEKLKHCAGIILSGGPQSVYDAGSPQADPKILELGIPVLGLCYGHQWLAHALGGEVGPGLVKEYGEATVRTVHSNALLEGLPHEFTVWMSHGDEVKTLPQGFKTVASTDACMNAAMSDESRQIFGIQWHIEVTHTQHGMDLLKAFVSLCNPQPWSIESYTTFVGEELKKQVSDRKVFMLVSGGVDSSVAFTLLNQVLGTDRVQGLLVDTGLMRKGEVAMIREAFDRLGIKNLHIEDASEEFFANLKDIYEPEEKRKIIGQTFLDVQKRVSERMGLSPATNQPINQLTSYPINHQPPTTNWLLGQGTIYPDTIETGGTKHASKIKTHHNRIEAIQKMMEAGLVVEPLKELYKDEVRMLGEELGLPHELVWRHPFPGPGLGVRILCAQEADAKIAYDEKRGEQHTFETMVGTMPWSVLPVKTVGVQGDGRTYRHALAVYAQKPWAHDVKLKMLATKMPNAVAAFNRVLLCTSHVSPPTFVFSPGYLTRERADLLREADGIVDQVMRQHDLYEKIWQFPVALLPFGTTDGGQSIVLRPVESIDAMTAHASQIPDAVLQLMTDRILKEVPGIDCVFLDLTSKPPGTIEWE